ncbi:MAG: VWA domain-containing protein, partial [Nitrospira sp.]|nr:VWA domain-containing protein [Nitrospira sp.]
MPANSETIQKEAIDLIQTAMDTEDRLAVISFGQTSAIERPPQGGKFADFVHEVGREESNLAEAIETALSLIPPDSPGRILLLSDGRWTGKDPARVASRAAIRGIAMDYRSLRRASTHDLAISHIDAPFTVTPGESFMITAWIRSPYSQEISFELLRGAGHSGQSQRLASGSKKIPSGLSRLTFRDQVVEPGTNQYTLTLRSNSTHLSASPEFRIQPDPIPENNTAKVLVGIQGP